MQTFGKRQYDPIELDPRARRPKPAEPRESRVPVTKLATYAMVLAAIGVIAFAGFDLLVMA